MIWFQNFEMKCVKCKIEFKDLLRQLNQSEHCQSSYDIEKMIEKRKLERIEKRKKHYDDNKSKIIENKKEYYLDNKSKIIEKRKDYYEANTS